eukprot:1139225-Pelagomonas_calceolata.AAC.3
MGGWTDLQPRSEGPPAGHEQTYKGLATCGCLHRRVRNPPCAWEFDFAGCKVTKGKARTFAAWGGQGTCNNSSSSVIKTALAEIPNAVGYLNLQAAHLNSWAQVAINRAIEHVNQRTARPSSRKL